MSKSSQIQAVFQLSPMQEVMLYKHISHEGTEKSFINQFSFIANGELDIMLLQESFNMIISRHDSLKTIFIYENIQKPRQVVLKRRNTSIQSEDISNLSDEKKLKTINKASEIEIEKGFNLSKDMLIRILVFKTSQKSFEVICTYHHIIIDGWSMGIILSELIHIYSCLKYNTPQTLNKPYSYKNYIDWYEKYDNNKIQFWKDKLSNLNEKTIIPRLKAKLDSDKNITKDYSFKINSTKTKEIVRLASKNGFTLSTVFHTLWGILVSKYNNSNDIVFGSVVAGRPADVEGVDSIVGLFLNTIPVRINHNKGQSFLDLLRDVNEYLMLSRDNEHIPISDIQSSMKLEGDLIDHIVIFENYPLEDNMRKITASNRTDFTIDDMKLREQTNYDFNVMVTPDEELNININYNELVYDNDFINRIEGHLNQIVDQVISRNTIPVEQIELLTNREKEEIIYDFNNTTKAYPKNNSIYELFEKQALSSPYAVAVKFNDEEITYDELRKKVNSLAMYLKNRGVTNQSIIGIMTERSIAMIVGILAVLKSGGAYLPIDPSYPIERIEYMLNDSNVNIILFSESIVLSNESSYQLIDISDKELYQANNISFEVKSLPQDRACIIYTSGSTGSPKGVILHHQGIINSAYTKIKTLSINQNYIICNNLSINFVASIWQLFAPLFVGAKLIVYSENTIKDSYELFSKASNDKVSVLEVVPSIMNTYIYLLEQGAVRIDLSNIKYLLLTGEEIKCSLIQRVHNYYDVSLINAYGQSECSDDTLQYEIPMNFDNKIVPIGKPLCNTQAYVLDKNLSLLPVGITGELYISGDGLSEGYINNDLLTKEKFIDNPYKEQNKIYKTGDLARWLPNGDVEYLGRKDFQVKIRGYRIELGEIESKILSHNSIKSAVVIITEELNGDAKESEKLCAYYTSDKYIESNELRKFLLKELPTYMVPVFFTHLEQMPLTPNGKINRNLLPNPSNNEELSEKIVKASTEMEKKIECLWKEILKTETVSVNDDFFSIGGHSLNASKLILRLKRELKIELKLSEFFKVPTIKKMSEYIMDKGSKEYEPIPTVEKKEYYNATAVQKRLYMIEKLYEGNTTYNNTAVLTIKGKLDGEDLKKAIDGLVKRHDSLRTSFHIINDEVVFKIHDELKADIEVLNATEQEIDEIIHSNIKTFYLETTPLFRVILIKISENSHILIFDIHHIVADGISMSILQKEFIELYMGNKLDEVKTEFKDFSQWQNKVSDSDDYKKTKSFWNNQFENKIEPINLPLDFTRPYTQSFDGDCVYFEASKTLTEKLNNIAGKTNSTMYMVLLATFNILISKYSQQEDIVVGSPISGRTHMDLENIVGMFVNTLALRSYPLSTKTFVEYLSEVNELTVKAFENQHYQFEDLIDDLETKRDLSRNTLIDIMFAYDNFNAGVIQEKDLEFAPYKIKSKTSKFDISLNAVLVQDKIEFSLEFCTALFRKESIEKMAQRFIYLLEQVINEPKKILLDFEIISQKEKEEILYFFNNTKYEYPQYKSLSMVFEEQVIKTPNNIAVVFDHKNLTYSELNQKSNKLARVLREKSVETGSIVGIMVERSLEMIIGIMAIIKAGAAYLPISPKYPKERIKYILEDSGSNVLLTQNQALKELDYEVEIIKLDDTSLYGNDGSNLPLFNKADDLAYVIYTSGSTGNPKGVMIEHSSIINRIHWMQRMYPINDTDAILQKTPYTFDVSVWEIFWWSFVGAKVCLLEPEGEKDPLTIIDAIKENNITTIHFVPSMLNIFLGSVNEQKCEDRISSLRQVFASGEVLSLKHVNIFNDLLYKSNNTSLHNLYGPTETAVDVSYYACSRKHVNEVIPIGRPIDNISLYILDKSNKLQPIGIPGELCISGAGVGRGYLNRSKLTKEKFVNDPFKYGERMYKTGDLARWLPDGNIEYLGRMDNQVKIRGYRIELGEIEIQLLKHKEVKEAVVVVKEDASGYKSLCAYISSEEALKIHEVRQFMKRDLPEYMIPAYIIQIDKIPLSANGKIDKKSLPEMQESLCLNGEYKEPRNEMEESLSEIWKEVLGLEKISTDSNFFEIGGHSLKATIIAFKIYKQLNIIVKVADLFNYQTIGELAKSLQLRDNSNFEHIDMIDMREYYNLSISQKSIYAACQLGENDTKLNIPVALSIDGVLDINMFEYTWKILMQRHEPLRTVFTEHEGSIVQSICPRVETPLSYLEAEEHEIDVLIKEFIKPFDLRNAPLFRLALVKISNTKHILLLDIHHIIFDGVSMKILINDFVNIYQGYEIQDLKVQYKDYIYWQTKMLASEKWTKQEEYWLELLSGNIPLLDLSTDFQRPEIKSFEGETIRYDVDEELTRLIKEVTVNTNTTMFMLLYAAYVVLLSRYTGQSDIIVGAPVAGRTHADINDCIGAFINTLAIRTNPSGEKRFLHFLNEVSEITLKALEYQNYPIELLLNKIDFKRDMSRNPLFDTTFTMQNTEGRDIQIEGLRITRIETDYGMSKHDISIDVEELNGKLVMYFEYSTGLFLKNTIQNFINDYIQVLKSIVENVEVKIEDIEFSNYEISNYMSDDDETVEFTF